MNIIPHRIPCNYDDYHYTDHTDSQIQPRHIQLDLRGKGLKKSLIRAALWLNPDWAVLGFAYVTPEEVEVVGDAWYANSESQCTDIHVFLLTESLLDLPSICLKEEHQQIQASNGRNAHQINPHSLIHILQLPTTEVPFFAKFVNDWQLLAECNETPNKLPEKVNPSWDSWKEKIEGLPKGMNLCPLVGSHSLKAVYPMTFYAQQAISLRVNLLASSLVENRILCDVKKAFRHPILPSSSLKPPKPIRDRIREAIKTAPEYGSSYEYIVYDNQCNFEDPRFAGDITVEFWTNVKNAMDGCTKDTPCTGKVVQDGNSSSLMRVVEGQ
ncbi:hypothetical protein EV368DRAFT_67768 [Lentinula lateritia]|nr:hypothetical protein EV368DRAFT_67768 [Lentinula lateritia]